MPEQIPCASRYLLRIAGGALFSGADAAANLSAIAVGLARPLQPELGDSAAAFAGPALLALLAAAQEAIAPAIPSLLSAIAGVLTKRVSSAPVLRLASLAGCCMTEGCTLRLLGGQSDTQSVCDHLSYGTAGKLAVSESTPVITGLLLVVARLLHLHLPDTLACLASQPAPHGAVQLDATIPR